MAIKNIIASGIGFSPGSIKYIPTHGFNIYVILPKVILKTIRLDSNLAIVISPVSDRNRLVILTN